MKQVIKNYTFSTSAKTITLTDFMTVRLDRLQAIIDSTTNAFLYNLVDPTVASVTVSTNVITLSTLPSGVSNGDALEIIYETATGDPFYDLPVVAGNVASGATDSGSPVKVGGIYNSTAITLSNGQRGDLQLDASGNLQNSLGTLLAGEDLTNNLLGIGTKPVVSSTYASSIYQSAGATTAANVKSSAGNLFSVLVTNANAAIRYFQLFNSTSAPTSGASALYTFLVPAGSATVPTQLRLDTSFFAPATYFSSGISFAMSTVATTYTAATPTDHFVTINYI